MNFKRFTVAILSAVITLGMLSGCGTENTFTRSLCVKELNGSTKVKNEKVEKKAAVGMNFQSGDNVSVQEKSDMTMQMDMDKYLYAEENTHFRLEAQGTEDNSKTHIRMEDGSVLISIEEKLQDGEEFVVDVPNAAMTVRGTMFRVGVNHENGKYFSVLDVLDGQVEVTLPSGTKELVPQGMSVTVVSESEEKFGFLVNKEGQAQREISGRGITDSLNNKIIEFSESRSHATTIPPVTSFQDSAESSVIPSQSPEELAKIPIDHTLFPDEIVLNEVKTFDLDGDNMLSQYEILEVSTLSFHGPVTTLKGIEHFPRLSSLSCMRDSRNYGKIENPDFSKNPNLKIIHFAQCHMDSLDLSHTPMLEQLTCYSCYLTSLDVSHNPELRSLLCEGNSFTELDISHNPKLERLTCSESLIKNLDTSHNPNLKDINSH